jgi:hypothetical protein
VADSGSHARHDRFAIADAIGGGRLPSTVRSCPACGLLHADLLTIQGAVRNAWVPILARDLRLSVADAIRLRRRSWRQRFALVGSAHDLVTRPLALSFAALGLAGLLLTSTTAGSRTSGSGAAPAEMYHAATGDTSGVSVAGAPSAAASIGTDVRSKTPAPIEPGAGSAIAPDPRPSERDRSLSALSLAMLGLGAGTFLVRRLASRSRAVR